MISNSPLLEFVSFALKSIAINSEYIYNKRPFVVLKVHFSIEMRNDFDGLFSYLTVQYCDCEKLQPESALLHKSAVGGACRYMSVGQPQRSRNKECG